MTARDLECSYVHGASATALRFCTVDDVLREAGVRGPDRPALIAPFQRARYSFGQLNTEVESVAAGLIELGLAPGDRLGLWAPNCAEWVITMFAAARAGLILVNINPAYRSSELEVVLRTCECRALIFADVIKSSNYAQMLSEMIPELATAEPGQLSSAKFPSLQVLIQLGNRASIGSISFADLRRTSSASATQRLMSIRQVIQPDDPFNIQFTSGTSGAPKGVTLTHFSLVNNARFVAERMSLTAADRLCIPVPMYHCFGMVLGVLAAMSHDAASIFPAALFDPLSVLQAVAAERCTALHGVPTMFIAELSHPRFAEFDLRALRTGIMAGAPCPISTMRQVVEQMHMTDVTICYGMTETSPVSFQTTPGDSLERRVGTVGTIHPHVEAKVVDSDGRAVARGVPGELLTRGYSVMQGYWNDLERTSEVVDSAGWMHTGDIATIDEDGYCRIVGRSKDMIIRGGENISPREIEEFLYQHPGVRDVAVVGVPDDRYGEAVCACIILRPGVNCDEDEILDFCRDKIAHYKIPRHVRFVSDFPLTVTGKVQKYLIRQRLEGDFTATDDRRT